MLQAMPVIWCGMIALWILAHLTAGYPCSVGITAAAAALAASLAGLYPWMQVLLYSIMALSGRLCRRLGRRRKAAYAQNALALVVAEDAVLYRGRLYRAQTGCPAACPTCGNLVRILSRSAAPNGERICTICVYGV